MSNAEGLEETLGALSARLGPQHRALIALARGLARALDEEPGLAALAKEYRATVVALMEAGAVDDADDDSAAFLSTVRTPGAEVVDSG